MTDLTERRRRARAARSRRQRGRRPLAYVDYTDNDGDTVIDEYAVGADGTFDPATRRAVLRASTSRTPTTTVATLAIRARRHAVHRHRRRRLGRRPGAAGAERRRVARARSCASTRRRRATRRTPSRRQPVRRRRWCAVPRDLVDRPAQPVAVQLRPVDRRPVDRRRRTEPVGGGRRRLAPPTAGAGRGAQLRMERVEGNHRFNDDQSPDGATPPILRVRARGATVARSAAVPSTAVRRSRRWSGWYVFGDYCVGQVRALQIARPGRRSQPAARHRHASVTAVTEGPDGELYVSVGATARSTPRR